MNKLEIEDPDEVLKQVGNLRSQTESINYLLFEYSKSDKLVLTTKGNGGLAEITPKFDLSLVQFGLVEITVTGDKYNPVKYVLICWIGKEVPPGIMKARAAGHRRELLDFLKTKIGITMEFEASVPSDLNQKSMADKLTKTSNLYVVDDVDDTKKSMARSSVKGGDTKLSQVTLVDSENLKEHVELAYSSTTLNWATLGYVKGTKDKIEFRKNGAGIEELKGEYQNDGIVFAVYGQLVKETTTTIKKILLITMVGGNAPPILKARSSPHREELLKFIKSMMPVHSQYQALGTVDLNESAFKEKLRAQ